MARFPSLLHGAAVLLFLFALSLFASPVSSFSSGLLPYCDLGTNRRYGVADLMNWARPPAATTLFTIRSGDGANPAQDPTEYAADVPVAIHVRATTQERFLGMVLYAIKGTYTPRASEVDVQAGSWTVSPNTPFQVIYPQNGGSCVTHLNSDWKSIHNVFYWTAPQGTGAVTFRILLKIGEQNSGFFVYPAQSLTLYETFPPILDSVVQANANESCHAACARKYPTSTKYCHRNQTAALTTSTRLDNKFGATTCRYPYMTTCSSSAPHQDSNGGWCSFNAIVCGQQAATHCLATGLADQRYCVCSANVTDSDLDMVFTSNEGGGGLNPGNPGAAQSSEDSMSMSSPPLIGGVAGAAALIVIAFLVSGYRKRKLAEKQFDQFQHVSGRHSDAGLEPSPLYKTIEMPAGHGTISSSSSASHHRLHPSMPGAQI